VQGGNQEKQFKLQSTLLLEMAPCMASEKLQGASAQLTKEHTFKMFNLKQSEILLGCQNNLQIILFLNFPSCKREIMKDNDSFFKADIQSA